MAKKLEKIIGKILKKTEDIRGLFEEEVTCYLVSSNFYSKFGNNIYCAFRGHYRDSPKKGDMAEFHLSDNVLTSSDKTIRKKSKDGFFVFEKEEINYQEIVKYKPL